MTFDVLFELGTDIYTATFVRILPYIIGIMTAIYLHKNHNQITISKVRLNSKLTQQDSIYN